MTPSHLLIAALVSAIASASTPAAWAALPGAAHSPRSALTAEYEQHLARIREARLPVGGPVGGFATLGVTVVRAGETLDPDVLAPSAAAALAAWGGDGALLLDVAPDSPAERAGLVPGDVIVGFSGLWVDGADTLDRLVSRARLGVEAEVLVLRVGEVAAAWIVPEDRCPPDAGQP